MNVTVIGCWGAYPKVGGANTSYLVEHDGFRLLVDCGSGVLAQLPKYCHVNELDAVFISHLHHDHIADVGVLQYARLAENSEVPLPIYSLDGQFTYKHVTEGRTLPERIGPFTCEYIQTRHSAVCMAIKLTCESGVVCYTADSGHFPELADFVRGSDLWIADCSYSGEERGDNHMSSTECGEVAAAANVPTLWLSHLAHNVNREQLVEEARAAFAGEIVAVAAGTKRNF